MSAAYGNLNVTGGSTAQSLTTAAALMTGWATKGPSSDTKGDLSIQPVLASNKMTLVPGVYRCSFSLSGNGSTTELITANLSSSIVTNTAVAGCECKATFLSSDKRDMSFSQTFTVAATGDYGIWLLSDGSNTFTPIDANWTIERLD